MIAILSAVTATESTLPWNTTEDDVADEHGIRNETEVRGQ